MLAWHILGWSAMAVALVLGLGTLWFCAGGWRQFGPAHLLPPPVPKLALVAPATDPIPGVSEYVGVV